jgi:hypothetical protein
VDHDDGQQVEAEEEDAFDRSTVVDNMEQGSLPPRRLLLPLAATRTTFSARYSQKKPKNQCCGCMTFFNFFAGVVNA